MTERAPVTERAPGCMIATALALLLAVSLAATPAAAQGVDDERGQATARAALLSAFADRCFGMTEGMFQDTPADVYEIEDRADYEGAPLKRYTLYRFSCDAGAYNLIDAWMLAAPDISPEPIAFATPAFDVSYADEEQTEVEGTSVTGFTAEPTLINSSYDPETRTITSYSKWRGLGDAYESGTWRFERGRFVLIGYEADPTYDGEQTPAAIYSAAE